MTIAIEEPRMQEVLADAQAGRPLAIVTGAAGAIGVAAVRTLVEQGFGVIAADLHADRLRDVFAEDDAVAGVTLDVTSGDQWRELAAAVAEGAGRLDALVNNAGSLQQLVSVENVSEAEFRRVLDVNLVGTFLGVQTFIPLLRRSNQASIVNLSSSEGFNNTPGSGAYSASKWAVRGLTKTIAIELAADGIRCNSVHPWGIDTPMARGADGKTAPTKLLSLTPLGRLGRPEEAAELIAFLAGPRSSYSTGSEFTVDGGQLAWSKF